MAEGATHRTVSGGNEACVRASRQPVSSLRTSTSPSGSASERRVAIEARRAAGSKATPCTTAAPSCETMRAIASASAAERHDMGV